MEKLRIGVIGCGSISIMHLESVVGLEQSELVAVCDIKENIAQKTGEKYKVPSYTDYKKMIESERLDAVHICLPHYLHTVVSQYALSQGVHVLCEKPMSISFRDAVSTVEFAEKAGLQYGIIFQSRYNTPSIVLKDRITSGKLGRVINGRITLTWSRDDAYYSLSDWKGTWEKEGGGVVIDQAIHSLDLANWFIDDTPVEVVSSLHNRNHKIIVVEDTAEGLIRYQNGANLFFWTHNNYFVDEPIEIRLVCEHGTATISYEECRIQYANGEEEYVKNEPQTKIQYGGGKSYWGTQHAVQINNFYNSILGTEPLEISGKEALKIQEIICKIYDNNESALEVPAHR